MHNDTPREIHDISTVISELSASMASVKESYKATTCDIKHMKKASGYRDSDHDSLFDSEETEDNDVDSKRKNSALVRGSLKRKKKPS